VLSVIHLLLSLTKAPITTTAATTTDGDDAAAAADNNNNNNNNEGKAKIKVVLELN
jgi:hypothetical protein